MRVLLASPFFASHWDAGHFWARALSRLGHSLILWDWRTDSEPPAADYDLALVLKGDANTPGKLHGYKLCYWPDELGRDPEAEGALDLYDQVYTMVRPTPPGMSWLPGAWDPVIHRPAPSKSSYDSIFIGTHTPYKQAMVIPIGPQVIMGNGWPHIYGGPQPRPAVYLHQFVNALSNAKVAINVHRVPTIGVTRRLFEFIACTFTLTDCVPGVEEILGKELAHRVAFRSHLEGRNMLDYFLSHANERMALWAQEQAAIKTYTYESLARRIFEKSPALII